MNNQRGLAGNMIWNLAGESVPVLAAVAAIPILVHSLGATRFGVLTLSWMIAGYFGMFDFGLGRALTKLMAQELGLGREAKAAALFWTALIMTLAFGIAAAATLMILAPWLIHSALKIPAPLQSETLAGCYLIALGLPLLVSAPALRGALTAADRFDLLNLVRTPSGIMSYLAPVLMLPFTHSLAWMIAALMLNRAASFVIYLGVTLRAIPSLRTRARFQRALLPSLLGFGAWITVSTVINPLMIYLDRFLIGAMISMAALTAYSVPMEIISKSFILPVAISGVMFPAFARSFAAHPESVRHLFERSSKLVVLILCPPCLVIVTFAPQIMSRWMGPEFALRSSAILQMLAVGAFVTGLSWIPLTLLHAAHRPDLTARIHLVDFPFYALVLWFSIHEYGVLGAAFAWSGRLLMENLVLFAMARRVIKSPRREVINGHLMMAAAASFIAAGAFISDLRTKAIFLCLMLPGFVMIVWRLLLDGGERAQISEYLRAIIAPHLRRGMAG